MKRPLIIIAFLIFSGNSIAQSNTVNILFDVDGIQLPYNNAFVEFVYNNDTTKVNIEEGKMLIPNQIFRKNVVVIFHIDKYVLNFDSIPVTLNNLSPKWTIGVDNKPFDKKYHVAVKSRKKVQIIYYLKNDDGRTFTVDGMKKSKIIL
jgi:hypothetical protein